MDDLFDQIMQAVDAGLSLLALAGALTVPDICAALGSNDGRTTGDRYRDWVRSELEPKWRQFLTAEDVYAFRCSFLHQGRLEQSKTPVRKLLFIEGTGNVHMNLFDDMLQLDLGLFCGDVTEAGRAWTAASAGSEPFDTNLATFVQRRADGIFGPNDVGGGAIRFPNPIIG